MNYFVFLSQLKKGMQITILLAMLLFSLGPGGVFSAYAAPTNDNFANAIDVPTIPYQQLNISTTTATIQTGEKPVPSACDGRLLAQGLHTVWYRFTPAATGLVSFDSVGSDYDTYIAIWTGTTLSNLTYFACDDDNLSSLQSQLLTTFQAGTTYYIQVAAYAGTVADPSNPGDVTGGNLNFHVRFPNVDVYVPSNILMGQYYLPGGTGERASYLNTNNGPVKLINVDTIPTIAAERVIYNVSGLPTSFSEMMALPDGQLDNTYWMPWYNNVDLDTQLRFGNVSGSPATVQVWIGTQEMTTGCNPSNVPYPYVLAVGASLRVSCPGVNNGPVKIVSNVNIVAAERVIYNVNGLPTSFTEMMGLPNSKLDNTYWMPWYNNVDLDTQLRFGNVSNTPATVQVFIGGQEKTTGCTTTPANVPYPYVLAVGASLRLSCPGLNDGPVQIVSNVNIVAAERVIYNVSGLPTSFTEMMGLPDAQLDNTYWMPWYNNVNLDTQLRFGNVSGTPATVRVWIGEQEMTSGCNPSNIPYPYVLAAGASLRVSCPAKNNGPVKIVSDVNIVAAERVIYNVNGLPTSFSEMMGLADGLLDTLYWIPWYNNVDLDTQLRFGMP
jgi:hypothetical protein